ncbi:MAG: Putative protein-S-isoprenylcysteine methyltransferase, partial [uncultured Rubrobacteraceae bacterium]
ERQRARGSGERGRSRAAAPDLCRRADRGARDERPVPGRLLATRAFSNARMASDWRRAAPGRLRLQNPARRGHKRGPVRVDERAGLGGSLSLYPQPALRGHDAVVRWDLRPGQCSLAHAAVTPRPQSNARRRDRTRRALPGAPLRRGVPSIQGAGAALDL